VKGTGVGALRSLRVWGCSPGGRGRLGLGLGRGSVAGWRRVGTGLRAQPGACQASGPPPRLPDPAGAGGGFGRRPPWGCCWAPAMAATAPPSIRARTEFHGQPGPTGGRLGGPGWPELHRRHGRQLRRLGRGADPVPTPVRWRRGQLGDRRRPAADPPQGDRPGASPPGDWAKRADLLGPAPGRPNPNRGRPGRRAGRRTGPPRCPAALPGRHGAHPRRADRPARPAVGPIRPGRGDPALEPQPRALVAATGELAGGMAGVLLVGQTAGTDSWDRQQGQTAPRSLGHPAASP